MTERPWSELLPETAEIFERVVMDSAQAVLPIPLRQVVDPAETPVAFLPFLAAHESVKLWFDDWSEARKRQMVAAAPGLADLIGTRPGLVGFLGFVDAQIVAVVAAPRRFTLGRSAVGRERLVFPVFTARYLIRVETRRPVSSLRLGRGALGLHGLAPVSREPLRRARIAASVSKGPGTQYTATFAWRRRPTFDEMAFDLPFDAFIDRTQL